MLTKQKPATVLFAVFAPLALAVNIFVNGKTLFLLNSDLDSGGYLFHNYFRTFGYEIFLRIFNVNGHLDFIPFVQLNLLLASFLYLSLGVLACFRQLGLAALVLLICCMDAAALVDPRGPDRRILCRGLRHEARRLISPGAHRRHARRPPRTAPFGRARRARPNGFRARPYGGFELQISWGVRKLGNGRHIPGRTNRPFDRIE
jgi:hypothetical protein